MNETGKTSTARVSRRATATEKFKALAGSGRSNAVLWILLGIGGLFGVVVLVMFLGDEERPEVLEGQFTGRLEAARRVLSEGELDVGLEGLREALKFAEEHEVLNRHCRSLRGEIREVEQRIAVRKENERIIDTFEKDFKNRTSKDLADLRRHAEDLLKIVPGDARVREMHATLLKEIEKEREEGKKDDFQWTRKVIYEQCGLDGKAPEWGRAISLWKAYQARPTVAKEDREKASEEIKGIEQKARNEFERLKRRETPEQIRKHRPRFEGTAVAADFDSLFR